MKKLTILLASLSVAATALPAASASAQAWQGINARQGQLEARIDQGVRSGALNRNEAQRLRQEYRGLVNLEARYRRGGLTQWERNDLNRRYDVLAAKIRYDRNVPNRRGPQGRRY